MTDSKTILITGATNGIGEVTARELARTGAALVLVSRSADKCAKVVQEIAQATGNGNVSYIAADLSTLAGIRSAAAEFLKNHNRLDVLINNAGAVFTSRRETVDGLEETFALNHLNYFLLTNLLLDTLKATAAQTGEARIVNVSSGAHQVSGITFDDLQRKKGYSAFRVYGESKLMNILFTEELARRLEGTNVTVNALHPGFVRTGFNKNNGGLMSSIMSVIGMLGISPEKGAQTSIYLATSPEVKGVTGKYFNKSKATEPAAVAHDKAAQARLWEISEQLAGITAPVAP